MDNLKETLELAIVSHLFVANGVTYYIDRVDCDEQVCYCHSWNGGDVEIDLLYMDRSRNIKFYKEAEL